MMVCAIGRMPPPPIPCTARAATRNPIVGASAQAIEPTMKIATEISITVRRPWMSESLPNNGVTAVAAKR